MFSHIEKSTFAAMAGVLLISLGACKGEILPDNSKRDILTTGSWRLTAYTANTMTGTTDVYASYRDCEKDNVYHFNKNGTLDIDEGAATCSVYDPPSYSVRWGFSNDRQTEIKIDNTDFVLTYISDNEFELSTDFNYGYGDYVKIKYGR